MLLISVHGLAPTRWNPETEPFPFRGQRLRPTESCQVTASGISLDLLRTHFTGLRMHSGSSVTWTGEDAQFIVNARELIADLAKTSI